MITQNLPALGRKTRLAVAALHSILSSSSPAFNVLIIDKQRLIEMNQFGKQEYAGYSEST